MVATAVPGTSLWQIKNKNKNQSLLRNCYEPEQASSMPRKSQNQAEKTKQEHRGSVLVGAFSAPAIGEQQKVLVTVGELAQTTPEVSRRYQKDE